jgi:hypothetical protein
VEREEIFGNYSGRGRATAYLNGAPWTGHGMARLNADRKFTIAFDNRTEVYQRYFEFGTSCLLPFKVGKYDITRDSCPPIESSVSKRIGGLSYTEVHTSLINYELIELEGLANQLIVEDIKGNWLHGTFQLAFGRMSSGSQTDYGVADTIIFTNGVFSVQAYDVQ